MGSALDLDATALIMETECRKLGKQHQSPLNSLRIAPILRDFNGQASAFNFPSVGSGRLGGVGPNVLSVGLPLDIDNLLTGDVERLHDVHRFIHNYDFLKFDEDNLTVKIEHSMSMLANCVMVKYVDSYLGATRWDSLLDDSVLASFSDRMHIVTAVVDEMQEERQKRFIDLATTIDYAMERFA